MREAARRSLAAVVAAAVLLVPSAAWAADPLSDSQSSAQATLGETRSTPPSGVTPPAPSGGKGPRVTYTYVPVYGPCVSSEGVPGNLEGWRVDPGGTLIVRCSSEVADAGPAPLDYQDLERTAASVTARVTPDPPSLSVEPEGRALVNQPVVVSVADPGAPPGDSAVNPLSGRTVTVTLGAPSYEWNFGSGWVSGGRGRSYSGGEVPAEGRGAPYVSHTYRRSGSEVVRVRATYPASYTVTGLAETFDLPDVVATSSAAVEIVQSRSELVRD